MPLEQALQVRGHPQRLAHVLLHEQHGQPAGQDLRQHAVDPLHDHRCEPQGQLVEQQHPRVGDQRPADGHCLLEGRTTLEGRPADVTAEQVEAAYFGLAGTGAASQSAEGSEA